MALQCERVLVIWLMGRLKLEGVLSGRIRKGSGRHLNEMVDEDLRHL